MQNQDSIRHLELEKCHLFLLGEQLIENKMKEGIHLEARDVSLIKEANKLLAGGRSYGVLVTASDFNSISEEARQLTASPDFIQSTVAKALLVHNTATRLVGNIYMLVNRPAMPTRLFTNREKAISWLQEMLENKG